MKDTNIILLLYIDMLRQCKDYQIDDFFMNTAYVSKDNKNIDLHNYSIEELNKVRDEFIKCVLEKVMKEIDENILNPNEYKSDFYDGQINLWEIYNNLDMSNKMKNAIVKIG